MILGVDTGGTFTDFVLWRDDEIRTHKVLSTPDNPVNAILQGIRELGVSLDGLQVVHGSTVATNAVLEGKLARTVFVTNRGFKDMLTIGRQARAELYNLTPKVRPPPVEPSLCLEVAGRMDATGKLLEPFDAPGDEAFKQQLLSLKPEAVAINLLFSFLDDSSERHVESLIPGNIFVTRSSSLLPVYREYERGITTWLNAATGPLMQSYLAHLQEQLQPATLTVMQSSGDTLDATEAGQQSSHLLLSGPAGGLLGAQAVGRASQVNQLMTFDMGGTSTDVALIDGEINLTEEGRIAGYPVAVPMVDMHTIGAGGGSLAWVDEGKLLHVGPQSAGAVPGPACYGQGGTQATVTDANLVLGHLPSQAALGGELKLDVDAAQRAVEIVAQALGCDVVTAANGIIDLANEHMAAALRVISVEKGYDPKDFTLVSFGGAGGLHVCELAERLGMSQAMVPPYAGVLSAFGMLVASRGRRYMQTFVHPIDNFDRDAAQAILDGMYQRGIEELTKEGIDTTLIDRKVEADLRYIGQSSTLRVSWGDTKNMVADFNQLHKLRYGHDLDEPVELVNLHCAVQAKSADIKLPQITTAQTTHIGTQQVAGIDQPVDMIVRDQLAVDETLAGPVIIVEDSSTIWVAPGWRATMDSQGAIHLMAQ